MREIIFRGKRTDNREWVEGSLHVEWSETDQHGNRCRFYRIIDERFSIKYVDSETVGQYTGLTDKDGKRIFEGDIVRIKGNPDYPDYANVDYSALIVFLDGGFCAIDGTIEDHGFRRYALARFDFDLEIISNIHDNPELLEDEE